MSRSPWLQGETPLDHDLLVNRNGNIYVVVGNNHPPNVVYAYPKYVPTNRKTLWCNRITCYERIPLHYEVMHIYLRARGLVEEFYDPKYNTNIIGLKKTDIARILYARERIRELLASPKTPLEILLVELVDELRSLGIRLSDIGVTGSILAGIHNDEISDIDLVVYGEDSTLGMLEAASLVLKPLTGTYMSEWVENHSRAYRLPREIVRKYYAVWRRGLYKNRVVSLIYVDDKSTNESYNYYSEIYYRLGTLRAVVEVYPHQVTSLYYPLKAKARIISIEKGLKIGNELVVVSYESLYSKPLYLGGKLLVEGALYKVKGLHERLELLIGVREHRGFIKPL